MTNANQMDLAHGRSAMWGIEAELLAKMCEEPGDHIEIGTLWGASAIIAAKAKPRPGRVFSIDHMVDGYWSTGDPGCGGKIPTARAVLENFSAAGVASRITLICANSSPLPITDVQPSTALIDAGHGARAVRDDWHHLSPITSRFIALHDCTDKHPGVVSAVEGVVLRDLSWCQVEKANSLIIMERII